jgi:hypothetical protein
MLVKGVLLVGVATVCALAAPRGPDPAATDTTDPTQRVTAEGALPTQEQFLALTHTDATAMFEACVRRFKREVHGFRAELHKQERVNGILHPPEVVHVSVREDPFAVRLIWDSGVRNDVGGTVYSAGENRGNMIIWRPTKFIKFAPLNPKEGLAVTASRYAITDSSLSHAMYRSYLKCVDAKARGTLRFECLGVRPVPEVGGRTCAVIRRFCTPDEIDNFSLDDRAVRDPATAPADAIHVVTVYIDVERWLQIGSVLTRADGELVGSYFFRDVELNPAFPAGTFTADGFKK